MMGLSKNGVVLSACHCGPGLSSALWSPNKGGLPSPPCGWAASLLTVGGRARSCLSQHFLGFPVVKIYL